MHLSMELKNNYILIKPLANFDAKLAVEARKMFAEVVEHADRNVILDLSISESIDSSGVGAIAFLHKRLTSLGFALELDGLNEQSFNLINLLKINQVMKCKANLLD